MSTATPDRVRTPDDVVYPDSDGMPMAENTRQFEWIVTIKEGLGAVFRDRDDVFVAGDLLWYPVEGQPKVRMAPDALVAFGRPKGYRGSYKQWVEEDIAPQVVFEVLSPGNRADEMAGKLDFYDRYGVEEYYLYDPDHGDLTGWRRGGGRLEPIPDLRAYVSPRLGIRFEPGEGEDSLEIFGPRGERFLTYLELVEERDAERVRAEEADRRAEEADRRAEETDRRAERLAARLRELGFEPE